MEWGLVLAFWAKGSKVAHFALPNRWGFGQGGGAEAGELGRAASWEQRGAREDGALWGREGSPEASGAPATAVKTCIFSWFLGAAKWHEIAAGTAALHMGLFPYSHRCGVKLNFDGERLQFANKFHSLFVGRDYGLANCRLPREDKGHCHDLLAVRRALQLGMFGQYLLFGLLRPEKNLAFQKLPIFGSEGRKM